eukprot:1342121-Amphidinium_carterae.2
MQCEFITTGYTGRGAPVSHGRCAIDRCWAALRHVGKTNKVNQKCQEKTGTGPTRRYHARQDFV